MYSLRYEYDPNFLTSLDLGQIRWNGVAQELRCPACLQAGGGNKQERHRPERQSGTTWNHFQ